MTSDRAFAAVATMSDMAEGLGEIVATILARFAAQNGEAFPHADGVKIGRALHAAIRQHGLPPPLAPDEPGAPGGISDALATELVTELVASADAPAWLTDAVRQVVKACFHPNFRHCRESYRQTDADGVCRRQELKCARRRTSGTHCVDCPYWTSLDAQSHADLLSSAWRGGPREFAANRDVFLPEDFRALRRWLAEAGACKEH